MAFKSFSAFLALALASALACLAFAFACALASAALALLSAELLEALAASNLALALAFCVSKFFLNVVTLDIVHSLMQVTSAAAQPQLSVAAEAAAGHAADKVSARANKRTFFIVLLLLVLKYLTSLFYKNSFFPLNALFLINFSPW
ncbi:MAG TPA: hypothetical protein DCP52_02995 [Elusimicrobia bacterium]|nr:hypothetical protein [Elusimicrobiota bacterium]